MLLCDGPPVMAQPSVSLSRPSGETRGAAG